MATAVIGVGAIGSAVARNLASGGEHVLVAARDQDSAAKLAQELGDSASATSVREAIEGADAVVLAIWLDVIQNLVPEHADVLAGKVVFDPSNPLARGGDGNLLQGEGGFLRTLPQDVSAGLIVSGLVPAGGHYVKAFGTLGAGDLASGGNREPERAALLYATDDDQAAEAAERLISTAGFDPVKVGGVRDALRLELPGGDLHQWGGLQGKVLSASEAKAAIG